MFDTIGPNAARIASYAARELSYAPVAMGYAQAFFEEHGALMEACADSAAMRRLDGIRQLGLKRGTRGVPETMVPPCGGKFADTTAMESVTRREHSERVCAAMVAFCALHGVPSADVRHAALAALFHDVGHPPFSHTTEPVLIRRARPHHEDVGQRVVREDGELAVAFRSRGIDVERVVSIMREEGDLGLRLKLVDTATYLVHDAASAGMEYVGMSFEWNVLRSISAVRDGAFEIDDAFVLSELMGRRTEMANLLYEHPYNRLNSTLLMELVDWLVREDLLSLDVLSTGVDRDVLAALDRAILSGAPAWVRSASRFVRGKPTELRQWKVSEHASEASARATPHVDLRPRFLLPAADFTGKTLPVRLSGGGTFDVRAPPTSRPRHHALWHTVTYAGPI